MLVCVVTPTQHICRFNTHYFHNHNIYGSVLIHTYYRSTSPPGGNQVDGLPPALSLPEAQQLRHSACCVQSSSASIRSRWRMEIKSHAAFRLLSLRQVARCLCRIPLGVFAASRLVSLHTLCRDRFPSRSVFPICFCAF